MSPLIAFLLLGIGVLTGAMAMDLRWRIITRRAAEALANAETQINAQQTLLVMADRVISTLSPPPRRE